MRGVRFMVEHVIQEEYLEIASVDFEIVDGLLLRKGAWNAETLASWVDKLSTNLASIEKVINHFHLHQLFWFQNDEIDATYDDLLEIGSMIKSEWQSKLDIHFPHLDITVFFDETNHEDRCVKDFNVTAFINR